MADEQKKKHAGGRPKGSKKAADTSISITPTATAPPSGTLSGTPLPGTPEDVAYARGRLRAAISQKTPNKSRLVGLQRDLDSAETALARMDKLNADPTQVALKQALADLALTQADRDRLSGEVVALTKRTVQHTATITARDAAIVRLEAENAAIIAACPACVTKQTEIERLKPLAEKWSAHVTQVVEDKRKVLRFAELREIVVALFSRYDGVIIYNYVLPGSVLSYSKQPKYSRWSDEAKRSLHSDTLRHRFAQEEFDEDKNFNEWIALKAEIKAGEPWGRLLDAKTLVLIDEEKQQELRVIDLQEGQELREKREAREPKVEYGGRGFDHEKL